MSHDWKSIFEDSYPILTIAAFIGITGGQILNSIESLLIEIPVLLFLIPVINSVGGNLGTVLGARVSSGLHSGNILSELGDKEMKENMFISFLVGAITYSALALGVLAASTNISLGLVVIELMAVIIGAGLILTTGIILLTILVSIWSYRKRLDPDNIVVPVVTTCGDFIGIGSLLFMIWMVIL